MMFENERERERHTHWGCHTFWLAMPTHSNQSNHHQTHARTHVRIAAFLAAAFAMPTVVRLYERNAVAATAAAAAGYRTKNPPNYNTMLLLPVE